MTGVDGETDAILTALLAGLVVDAWDGLATQPVVFSVEGPVDFEVTDGAMEVVGGVFVLIGCVLSGRFLLGGSGTCHKESREGGGWEC